MENLFDNISKHEFVNIYFIFPLETNGKFCSKIEKDIDVYKRGSF